MRVLARDGAGVEVGRGTMRFLTHPPVDEQVEEVDAGCARGERRP